MAGGKFEKGDDRTRAAGSKGGSKGGGHKFSSGSAAAEAGRRGAYVKYLNYLTANLQRELTDARGAREAREAIEQNIDATLRERVASERAQRKSAISDIRGLARAQRLAAKVGVAGEVWTEHAEARREIFLEELGPVSVSQQTLDIAEREAVDPELEASRLMVADMMARAAAKKKK